ncbi:unnamed protein product [Mytilus coruscus]|uniref:Uncharacterized protein n=1 Tax=Mytilus coruscus TaxID=42192 RepID=A0A6J8CYY9_MYTCO|nr:unnamed protein product [Mytilus coruscus]
MTPNNSPLPIVPTNQSPNSILLTSSSSEQASPASRPASSASKPTSSASKPASSTSKSESSIYKPSSLTSLTSKPTSCTSKPASTASKSESSTYKPTSSAFNMFKPASSISKPASSASKSESSTYKPSSLTSKPSATYLSPTPKVHNKETPSLPVVLPPSTNKEELTAAEETISQKKAMEILTLGSNGSELPIVERRMLKKSLS